MLHIKIKAIFVLTKSSTRSLFRSNVPENFNFVILIRLELNILIVGLSILEVGYAL